MEVVIGDGTTRRFGPGDAVLFEDLTIRVHQPERRWGPPDHYRALSGLAIGCAGLLTGYVHRGNRIAKFSR